MRDIDIVYNCITTFHLLYYEAFHSHIMLSKRFWVLSYFCTIRMQIHEGNSDHSIFVFGFVSCIMSPQRLYQVYQFN